MNALKSFLPTWLRLDHCCRHVLGGGGRRRGRVPTGVQWRRRWFVQRRQRGRVTPTSEQEPRRRGTVVHGGAAAAAAASEVRRCLVTAHSAAAGVEPLAEELDQEETIMLRQESALVTDENHLQRSLEALSLVVGSSNDRAGGESHLLQQVVREMLWFQLDILEVFKDLLGQLLPLAVGVEILGLQDEHSTYDHVSEEDEPTSRR